MKIKKCVMVVVLCLVALVTALGGQRSFAGMEFADGRIYLQGWFENLTALQLQSGGRNDKGNFQMMRNTLQTEINVKLSDNFSFFIMPRAYYEGMWDLDHSIDDRPEHRHAAPKGAPMQDDIELREWYATLMLGEFTFKIGRQQLIWGESDALRMADIINPLDTSWHYVHEDWENIRIPLRMINMIYEPECWRDYHLRMELVWIPEDFKVQQFAPEGGVWAIPGLPQIIWNQERMELPDAHTLKNSEVGGRIRAVLGDWEFSLFDFYARVDNAVYSLDFGHAPLPLRFEWPFMNTVGGTFNYYEGYTKTVLRGEMACNIDQPFITVLNDRIEEKNTISWMLGFDRPTMIRILNPTRTFFISGQWFHGRVLDYEQDIRSVEMDDNRYWNVVSLLVNTDYWHDYLRPQILYVYDFSGNGFFNPTFTYTPNDRWSVTVGSILLFGHNNNDGLWGPMRRNDEISLRVRIKF